MRYWIIVIVGVIDVLSCSVFEVVVIGGWSVIEICYEWCTLEMVFDVFFERVNEVIK